MQSINQKTHFKKVRQGLSIYKTGQSQYYFARIWLSKEKRYTVKTTKETSRLDALEVAEEIFEKLKQNKVSESRTFNHFSKILMKYQKSLSGKTRSERFARDDEKIILRENDGLNAYFGNRDINEITTFDLRDYLTFLDDSRNKPLSASSKSKHLTIIGKIFKIGYEKGSLKSMPIIPTVSKSDNPRPSFSEDEYKHLLKTTREVVDKNVKVRGLSITEEMYYFIVFMTHTFMRPIESEIFAVKYQDIEVKYKPNRLEIKIRGKTGFRIVSSMPDALDFYDKLRVINTDHKPTDYLFFNEYPNRTTALRNVNRMFNYILEEGNLKETADGQVRTPYALRHYSLQTRLIKSKGKVNIFNLAKNAGTSVEQLERFYLKKLQLNDELVENLQIF